VKEKINGMNCSQEETTLVMEKDIQEEDYLPNQLYQMEPLKQLEMSTSKYHLLNK
jgi:hypothetical protein